MSNLLSNLLAMSIAGSAVVLLMLLFRPVTAKIFPAKWQYGIGKMAIAFFLLPVFLFAVKLPLMQPNAESYPAEPSIIRKALPALPSNGFVDAMDILMEKHLTVELTQVLLLIWFVGAMVFAGWHFYCYGRFSKQLRADSFPVPENTAAVLLSSCKATLGIHGEVNLMLNPKIKSPMLAGLRRPVILLPTLNMPEMDVKLILIHELMHLKRKDLWVKMLALLAGTVHWFNPLVHILRKDISTWGELACDEALASQMSHKERIRYGEAILNTLDNHSGINTAFCSSLCESKKHIERRLIMLLNVKKMKKHIGVFAVVAIVAIASIGTAVSALAAEYKPNPDRINQAGQNVIFAEKVTNFDNNKDMTFTQDSNLKSFRSYSDSVGEAELEGFMENPEGFSFASGKGTDDGINHSVDFDVEQAIKDIESGKINPLSKDNLPEGISKDKLTDTALTLIDENGNKTDVTSWIK